MFVAPSSNQRAAMGPALRLKFALYTFDLSNGVCQW